MNDSGFLFRGGFPLTWAPSDLPIAVLLDASAVDYEGELDAAVAGVNRAALTQNFFLRPTTTLLSRLVDAFDDEKRRPSIRSTILVRGDGNLNERHLGSTDFRFDERSGRIINAIVTLPPRAQAIEVLGKGDWTAGQQLIYQAALHELGHVLGLDHDDDPSSIMHPQVRTDAVVLLAGDVGRLQSVYG